MGNASLKKRSVGGLSPVFGSPFRSLRSEMDELLGQITQGFQPDGSVAGPQLPCVDLAETSNTLELTMDLPGLKPEEIDIKVSGDRIRISGEHVEEKEEKDKKFHRVERSRRSFFRTVDLPCAIVQQEISAEIKDGVLVVTMPKCEEAKTQKISVKG